MYMDNYKIIVSTIATIVTIIQFLSGSEICFRIMKQGSTGDISGFPFIGGTFATSVWLLFSCILHDIPMMITNIVGLSLQIVYLVIYVKFCLSIGPWKTIKKQLLILSTLLSSILCYAFVYEQDQVILKTHIGLICSVASIFFILTPLVSLQDVFRMKSTEVLPFPLIVSMCMVGGSWGLYGLMIDNSFVAVPNIIGCIIAMFELSLFVIYPRKSKEPLLIA